MQGLPSLSFGAGDSKLEFHFWHYWKFLQLSHTSGFVDCVN